MKKRVTAMLLCLVMVAALLPAQAFGTPGQTSRLRVHYDQNGGSLFAATGENTPQAIAGDYLFDGESEVTAGQTVRLLFSEQLALDWNEYEQSGNVAFTDPWTANDRAIYVVARYDTAAGWFDGPVVENGAAVRDGFSFENNILTFTMPENGVELEAFWTAGDYAFSRFQGTDEAPVLVECNWWGDGDVLLPDDIPAENVLKRDGRLRVRVPFDRQTLTLSWTGTARRINVDGAGNNGGRLEIEDPEGTSYTLALDQTDGDNKATHYNMEFEFEGGGGQPEGAIRVDYDMNRCVMFASVGGAAETFAMSNEDFSFLTGEGVGAVSLRFDTEQCFDWEKFNETDERAFLPVGEEWHYLDNAYIQACFEEADGEWFDGLVVRDGEVVKDGFTFENGVLSFTPPSARGVEIRVYTSGEDYDFGTFGGTVEKPVVVEYRWWGAGSVRTMAEIPAGDKIEADGRVKIRVPLSYASVIFAWNEGDPLRRIGVEGGGENGDYLEIFEPEGSVYVLSLGQQEPNGDPRTFYHIEFDFDGGWHGNGEVRVNGDNNGGAVFAAAGEIPTETREYSVMAMEQPLSFLKDGEPTTINLLLDGTKKVDFDKLEQGEFALTTADFREDRALYVCAGFENANGEWIDEVVVADGKAVYEGFTFENNVLSYTPVSDNDVEFEVFWSKEDYEFARFNGTEEAPVILEINWWGSGAPVLPDGIPEENIKRSETRLRVRLPEDQASIVIGWEGTARRIGVDGAGGQGERLDIENPEGASYTLTLDQIRDDGEPETFYHIEMEFEDSGEVQANALRIDYDTANGSVFYQGEYVTGRKDLPYEQDQISVTLDPARANSRLAQEIGGFDLETLATPVDPYAPCVFVRYPLGGGEWYEEFVVWNGVSEVEGYIFDNNVLTFEPATADGIQVVVFWNEADFATRVFEGTEEKPVVVDVLSVGKVPLEFSEAVGEEDISVFEGATQTLIKFRLPAAVRTLTVSWPEDETLTKIIRYFSEEGPQTITGIEGGSFALALDDDRNYYMMDFRFADKPAGPDTAALIAALQAAGAVKRRDYTDLSLRKLDEAVTAGNALLEDKTAPQTDADAAASAIWAAIRGLAKRSPVKVSAFADVKPRDWYYASVKWAVENNVTAGTDATHFAPNKTCTRAEVVAFLWNAAGRPAPKAKKNPFADVKKSDWFYKAVLWAVETGITKGTDETHFAPNKTCTRAEVVVFLRASEGNPEPATAKNPFTDIKKKDWFYKAVLWAVETGVTKGTDATHFAPNKTCSRCEIVTFMYQDFING